MPCLKDNTITDNPSCDPSPSSIPVEVETISEPTLEPPQEPETNSESSAPSSTPVPETSDPILDGSDEEEEHLEAQTQALSDYQLARVRVLLTTLGFSSFSFGSAVALLSLFWCFYAVNQSSLSPCLSVGPFLRVITPIIIFLHYRRLDTATPLLGVRFWFGNPSVSAPRSSL
ncbi:hypothetical protein M9H77_14019 [Catharanthus roseus]|uniref:Uncharacterized protein n=1 Tax=Catharanthus roseus TaxID=4058 RepID=A0ACC0BLU5_CATRO|nr:hypothetical protein M9H77_14019 [Catharanthus roseus]